MKVPFGEIVDDVWILSWEDRIELLEQFVGDSGWTDPEQAHDEFWSYVQTSEARYMHKEFESLPEEVEEEFNRWVKEEE